MTLARLWSKANTHRKMISYDTPMKGQAYIQKVKRKLQADILAYLEPSDIAGIHERHLREAQQTALCQIVSDNFENLEQ